jgi:hypothetical protein
VKAPTGIRRGRLLTFILVWLSTILLAVLVVHAVLAATSGHGR